MLACTQQGIAEGGRMSAQYHCQFSCLGGAAAWLRGRWTAKSRRLGTRLMGGEVAMLYVQVAWKHYGFGTTTVGILTGCLIYASKQRRGWS